ncbi:putative protease [Nostocoides japonicum T1-X7]|uniref:Putative protease n=1 Tax=Nostocoides japonicum T1-X7 TaxID=1194083 RepID=A0A077LU75_9MICO|nr:pitrilysin family protein [Tetrasphaera japonica]CCH77293.1 putative protease [Tetrasphaera japonica T1-X7]
MSLSTRPAIGPPGPWTFPVPLASELPSGLRVLTHHLPGQYVVSVRVVVPLLVASEPRELEGIATLMSRLLDEGTLHHTPIEFAGLLERGGIGLGAGMTESALVIELDVPQRRLAQALDLLRQLLAEPAFPEAEVRRAVATRTSEIEQQRAHASHRAGLAFFEAFFDPAERASRPAGGTTETVGAVTRADLVAFHAERVGPLGATVVVAGDLTGVDATALVGDTLGRWTAPSHVPAPGPRAAVRAADAARIVVVDRPGSVQSELAVGWSGPDRHVTEPAGWAAYQVLSFVIGGSPNARIDAVLREEKGYTYGIRSAFRPRRVGGTFYTSGSVRSEVTVEALRLLLDILDGARSGYTVEEVRSGADFIGLTAPGRYATADAVAAETAGLVIDGLPSDFTTSNLAALGGLTPQVLRDAASAYLTGEWTVVVVGDAAAWLDGVRALGRGDVTVVPA